jgi:hypothetical protein
VNVTPCSVTTGASGGRARTTVGTGDRCDVSYRSRLGDIDAVEKSCTYLLEGNQLGTTVEGYGGSTLQKSGYDRAFL